MKYSISAALKIESLLFLKSLGLAPEPLLILDYLPQKEIFWEKLREAGFRPRQKLTIRFAYRKIMEMPAKVGARSFREAFNFIQQYFKKGSCLIIHPFVKAAYVGTLYFKRNDLLINLSKSSIWEPSVAKNCDIFLIKKNQAYVYRYKKKRVVYVPYNGSWKKEVVVPLTNEEISKLLRIFKETQPLIALIKKFPGMILEFIITPNYQLKGMELKRSAAGIQDPQERALDLMVIRKYSDMKKWDHQKDLLLTLTVFRKDKEKFLKLINQIKPYKKEVFIEYGVLSHPAILLREQGIRTKPYVSSYEILSFPLELDKIRH